MVPSILPTFEFWLQSFGVAYLVHADTNNKQNILRSSKLYWGFWKLFKFHLGIVITYLEKGALMLFLFHWERSKCLGWKWNKVRLVALSESLYRKLIWRFMIIILTSLEITKSCIFGKVILENHAFNPVDWMCIYHKLWI